MYGVWTTEYGGTGPPSSRATYGAREFGDDGTNVVVVIGPFE